MHAQRNPNWMPRDQNKMHNNPAYSFSVEEKLLVMEALDHLYVTRQYQEMGSCSVCKKISLKKCSGCNTFYCSSECQTFDWPKHRVKCSKQRDSFSDTSSFASTRRMRTSNFKNFDEQSLMINNRGSPFTALANQLKRKSANSINESKNPANFKIGNKHYQKKDQMSPGIVSGPMKGAKEVRKSSSSEERKGKGYHSPKNPSSNCNKSSPEERKTMASKKNGKNISKDSNKKMLKSIENIPSEKPAIGNEKSHSGNLKNIGRAEVIATYRESANRYWVMLLDDLKKYEEIQFVLNEECENYEEIKPKVGLVCGCEFEKEWFRAEVVSVTPIVKLHFIDYGNTSNYDRNVFKKLPDHLISTPGLVFQIEFEDGTPQKYKTEELDSLRLVVEETRTTFDGIHRVKVIEGMFGATEIPLQLAKPPEKKKSETIRNKKEKSAMDTIDANTNGMLFFLPGEGLIRYASIVPDNNRDASESLEKVLNIDGSNLTPVNAEEGDLVIVTDGEGNNQRGRVITKVGTTDFVQLIDCGNVISSKSVYAMPDDLKELMELGVKISMQELYPAGQVKGLETCFFSIKGESVSGKWPCILKTTERQILAEVLLEKPNVDKTQWRWKYKDLKSGSTVEISSVISPNSFYVRPVDVEMEQKLLDMNMEMIQFAPKAKDYRIPPSPAELCCAKFEEDGCFYRAVVTSVQNGKIRVLFVDFGNEQETDLKDIKPLPETLKKVPFLAVKVELRNVSTKPWNNMIKDYIGKLTSENVELTLTYTESLSNGVTLREKVSGIVVNDFLEKAKDKTTVNPLHSLRAQPENKGAEIFLDDDMDYTKLEVGRSCTLAILYVSECEFKSSYTFWATPTEVDNFNYVNVDLSSLICDHCESVTTPYEPGYRELCLAEFEGSWYRAICAGNDGDVYKVFFVDFGNCCELKSKSIRKMEKKFLMAPALAMNCTFSGREKLRGNTELVDKIFSKLMERINTFIGNVTVKKFEEDTFVMEIPEIKEILSS